MSRTGARVVLRLDGELDIGTADIVRTAFDQLLADDPAPPQVVVDASRLAFVDASGLQPLLDARRRLPAGALRLRNVRPPILRVLRLLDLAGAFGLDG